MTGAGLPPLLDTLLPGDGGDWPAAGAHGLAPRFAEMAGALPGGAQALAEVLGALPGGFAEAAGAAREMALAKIEAAMPEAFGLVVTAAYDVYYTDPAVRAVIERKTGYAARAPQPGGHDLPPFDPALLEAVRSRGPLWRDVPEAEAAPGSGDQEGTPGPGGQPRAPVPGDGTT